MFVHGPGFIGGERSPLELEVLHGPNVRRVTLFRVRCLTSGEIQDRYAVDARELVHTGQWEYVDKPAPPQRAARPAHAAGPGGISLSTLDL